MTSVKLPNTITEFESPTNDSYYGNQFNSCTNLKTLNIPAIKKIPSGCFLKCGLETIRVPYGVEEIDNYAFSACWGLKNLFIPSSVKNIVSPIVDVSYNNLGELTRDITLENVSLNYDEWLLANRSFSDYRSNVSYNVYIPNEASLETFNTLRAMYPKATFKPGAYDFIISDTDLGTAWCTVTKTATGTTEQTAGEAKYVRGPSPTQTLQAIIGLVKQESPWVSGAYPSEQRYYNVNTMAVGAFDDCVNLTKVTLNTELDSIPDYAFRNTIQLYAFPFENALCKKLKHIGLKAFYNSGLSGDMMVTLYKGFIDYDAFSSCKRLNSLLIADDYYYDYYNDVHFSIDEMNSNFRCYLPEKAFYGVLDEFESPGYYDKVFPYVRSKCKYSLHAFPSVRNRNGELSETQAIKLGNILKEGGKIYRAACKRQNPVDANGYTDLIEVDVDPQYDYEYSGAYESEGYVFELQPGKIYKLDRQALSNLAGKNGSSSDSEYNLLKDALSFKAEWPWYYGRAINSGEYVASAKDFDNLSDFYFSKVSSPIEESNTLVPPVYVSLSDFSQSPIPNKIRFRIPVTYDLNGDGKVSTADIQVIINEMKKPAASQNMSYDLNGDGKISTADIQVIINEMKK